MKTLKIEDGTKKYILDIIKDIKKGKTAKISGTKEINAIKKIAETLLIKIEVYNPQGDWNGYGYDKLPKVCIFPKTKVKNFLLKNTEEKASTYAPTEEEKTESWIKRLSKLTRITEEEAKEIANEKIEYKEEKIDEMEERQNGNPSIRRDKLINKMRRENPLRRIEDKEHAERILSASARHNESNYEDKLEEGRELAQFGDIDKGEVREYARMNLSY